jgi:hypothetical protein
MEWILICYQGIVIEEPFVVGQSVISALCAIPILLITFGKQVNRWY